MIAGILPAKMRPRTNIFHAKKAKSHNSFALPLCIDSSRSTFVGDIAARNKTNLKFTQPIKNGVIVDWDDMEDVWNHLFLQNLRIDPEVHKVLMTEPPHNDNFKREKMTQILFEYFNIPALQIASTAVLSLIATGYR